MQSHAQIEQSEQVELSTADAHSCRSSSIILPSGRTSVESQGEEPTAAALAENL